MAGALRPTFADVARNNPGLVERGWQPGYEYGARLGPDVVVFLLPGNGTVWFSECGSGQFSGGSTPDFSAASPGDFVDDGYLRWYWFGLTSAWPPAPTTWATDTTYDDRAVVYSPIPDGHLYCPYPNYPIDTTGEDAPDFTSSWTHSYVGDDGGYWFDMGVGATPIIEPPKPWRLVIKGMLTSDCPNPLTITVDDSYTDTIILCDSGYLAGSVTMTINGTPSTDGIIEDDPTTGQVSISASVSNGDVIVISYGGGQRGPGSVVAIIYDALALGATRMFNGPGEAHWTLMYDHPQIGVIIPKRTHYSIQFWRADDSNVFGWVDVFEGLVDDFDANEEQVIFYGKDYLALYQSIIDERYNPDAIDTPPPDGSKYDSMAISDIILDQLQRARGLPNSPVGFIKTGTIETLPEVVTVWSTMQSTLQFCVALINSHTDSFLHGTELVVEHDGSGGFQVSLYEGPSVDTYQHTLRYGELVQGYRVVPFGTSWATRLNGVGRTREGIKAYYYSQTASGIDEAVWGRFAVAQLIDNASSREDLQRQIDDLAQRNGRVGRQVGLSIRSEKVMPFDGYKLFDEFIIDIKHGIVDTTLMNSGEFMVIGVTWEVTDTGGSDLTLSFQPEGDASSPDPNLLRYQRISPQARWQ